MAGGEGFEPSTPNLGGWCSIRAELLAHEPSAYKFLIFCWMSSILGSLNPLLFDISASQVFFERVTLVVDNPFGGILCSSGELIVNYSGNWFFTGE